jgi:hypothetical protein
MMSPYCINSERELLEAAWLAEQAAAQAADDDALKVDLFYIFVFLESAVFFLKLSTGKWGDLEREEESENKKERPRVHFLVLLG